MNDFFAWEMLGTFAGAVTATALVTQFVKGAFDAFVKLPTQIVSYIIALIVLLMAAASTGLTNPADWALAPLNAVIVSLGANGAYSAVLRARDRED